MLVGVKEWISGVINIGNNDNYSDIEQRNIRLVNSFALISALLIILFAIMNITISDYWHALALLCGLLIIPIPTLYFSSIRKHHIARNYLLIVGLIFIDAIVLRSILNHQHRYNEVFMIGYSALIVVLTDKRMKIVLFLLTGLSTLAMITFRQTVNNLTFDGDVVVGYINVVVGFGCVYFFLSIYKKDLLKSYDQINAKSNDLEKSQTKIKIQHDEIASNRQLLRATIDNLPLFISLLDMNGKYLIANSLYEKTFNLPLSQIEGRHYREVLPANILSTHESLIARGYKGEEPEFDEITQLPGGEEIQSFGKYVPIYNDKNEQMALGVYVLDITALKQTESKLREANEMKNHLLGIIGHDLKGPIMSLQGLLCLSDNISEVEFTEYLARINKQLSTVTYTLENLLNWAKAKMEGVETNPSDVDLVPIIKSCIELFDQNLTDKNIAIKLNIGDQALAKTDKESIRLVIRNILSNAIKFSPTGEKVEIKLRSNKTHTEIEICDNGAGMTTEKIAEIREFNSTSIPERGTTGERGAGLGLSLCMEILNQLGSHIKFEKGPSGGTSVKIKLPVSKIAV